MIFITERVSRSRPLEALHQRAGHSGEKVEASLTQEVKEISASEHKSFQLSAVSHQPERKE